MYCSKCGIKLEENAKFCYGCGSSTGMYCSKCENILEENAEFCHECGSSTNPNDVDNKSYNELTEEELLKSYVGEKSDVYFRKWGLGSEGIRKVSINFPALLFPIFWAAYRKMYGLLFAILVVFLIIDAYAYSKGIYDVRFDIFIGTLTGILLGMLGNYIYYRQAKVKIDKLQKKKSPYFKKEVEKAGGTSYVGLLIGLLFVFVYSMISTNILYPAFAKESTIEFGFEEVDGTIANPSNRFKPLEEMHYLFYFSGKKGGAFKIVIERVEGSSVTLYDSWDDEVPPDWPGVINSIDAPEEEGEYIMKIIKDDKVLAKGTFFVNH